MALLDGLVYVEEIEPTLENAREMKRLTLQDVLVGGFPKPLELADPTDDQQVRDQRQKLLDHPERYSGYAQNGKLVAYMKQNTWFVDDATPFAMGWREFVLKAFGAIGFNPSTGQWAVFGLVASEELGRSVQEEVLVDLLRRSFNDPRSGRARTVNIVLHKNDPLLSVMKSLDFLPKGKLGEAAGAPGLKQRRFQRPAVR